MTDDLVEGRSWAADKRDFVADRRDDIADQRDVQAACREALADAREQLADAREAELDAWERRLSARAAELGLSDGAAPEELHRATADRAAAASGRRRERHDRDRAEEARSGAGARRQEATVRRLADNSPTQLALAFAEIARYLYAGDNVDEVLTRVVQTAVSAVTGCRMSSITIRSASGAYHTAATTDVAATSTDDAQYDAGEGPCLDAVDEALVYAPNSPTSAGRGSARGRRTAVSARWPPTGCQRPTSSAPVPSPVR